MPKRKGTRVHLLYLERYMKAAMVIMTITMAILPTIKMILHARQPTDIVN